MWWVLHFIIPLVIFSLIFGFGRLFPFSETMKEEVSYIKEEAPPGWVFAAAWFYTSLAVGLICSLSIVQTKKWIYLVLPLLLVSTWCAWIVNEHTRNTKKDRTIENTLSTGLLILSGVFLSLYMSEMCAVVGPIGYVLLPSVFWLFLAIFLNGYSNHQQWHV